MSITAKYILLIVASVSLAGCANFNHIKTVPPGWDNLTEKATKGLPEASSVLKVKTTKQSFELAPKPLGLPAGSDPNVSVEFAGVDLDKALYAISAHSGVNIFLAKTNRETVVKSASGSVSGSTGSASVPPVATAQTSTGQSANQHTNKKISMRFKGRLSELLKVISENAGVFFQHENGVIYATEAENFMVEVPSYPKLLDEVEASINALGGRSVAYDRLTSTISFTADYYSYKKIAEYCKKLKSNAVLVTMRILLLNVRLTSGESAGIDWTKMIAGGGAQKPTSLGYSQTAQASSSSTATSTTTATTGSTTVADLGAIGAATVFNSTGANLFVEGANFSISAMLSFIENFGRMSVMQNVFVESLSGTKGQINVLTETPYVSEVSFTSLSNQASLPSQAVKTDKAKDGVEMEITPFYSKQEGILSIGLKMALLSVVRMVDLEAGQQIGRITQPETTRKNVETYLRMTPSQVAIIGGLVLEKTNDGVVGLPGDSYLSKNVTTSKAKEEMVIVVKPTIIEFEPS